VVTHSPLTPSVWVQLPVVVLSCFAQTDLRTNCFTYIILYLLTNSGSVKYVATSKQWVTAVEDYEGDCRRCDALATNPMYRPSQDVQSLGY